MDRIQVIKNRYAPNSAWPVDPDDVRYLLSELEDERAAHNEHVAELLTTEAKLHEAQQEVKRYKRVVNDAMACHMKCLDRNQKLIEVLRFYALEKNYRPPKPFYVPLVVADEGKHARRLLIALGVSP